MSGETRGDEDVQVEAMLLNHLYPLKCGQGVDSINVVGDDHDE